MQAEALSDGMEVPAGLGVMRAEALPDNMQAPLGLACGLKPSLTTCKPRWGREPSPPAG